MDNLYKYIWIKKTKGGIFISNKDKSEKAVSIMRRRTKAYERAMQASVLLSGEYFETANNAIATKNGGRFKEICQSAGVPVELQEHMWNIIDAAYDTVYSKKGIVIMW